MPLPFVMGKSASGKDGAKAVFARAPKSLKKEFKIVNIRLTVLKFD